MCVAGSDVPTLFCAFETGVFDHTSKCFILDQLIEIILEKYRDYYEKYFNSIDTSGDERN